MSSLSGPAPSVPPPSAASSFARPAPSWRVRAATLMEAPAAAAAVRELLVELGATPPAAPAMQAAARRLIEDPAAGTLLVAAAEGGAIVGVLGASWQSAIHIPGRYALIQDLWVHPERRGEAVGSGLLTGLFERARSLGITRVEVGLPRERFAGLRATEGFYLGNGFAPLGARMRLVLS